MRSFLFIPKAAPVVNHQWSDTYPTGAAPTISQVAGALTITPTAGNSVHYYARTREFAAGYDIVVRFNRSTNTAASRLRIGLGSRRLITGTGGERSSQGFFAQIDDAGSLTLLKDLANVESTLGGPVVTKAPAAATSYYCRLSWGGTGGAGVRARVWAASGSEPGTWDIDVSDPGDVTRGWPEFSMFRDGTGGAWTIERVTIEGARILTAPGPLAFFRGDKLVPNGRAGRDGLRDDGYRTSLPAELTVTPGGALTTPAGALARQLAVAGSASATVAWPAITATLAERIELKLEGSWLSATSGINARLQLVGASKTYELCHLAADTTSKLTDGTLTQTLLHQWVGTDEGDHKRNLSLVLLPRLAQMQAWMDDQCIGWLDLSASVTEALTPTLKVDATTASARSLNYRGLALAAEGY